MPSNWSKRACVSMVVALGLLSARDASAFDLKHTPSGSLVRWDTGNVTFVVDPSVAKAMPGGVQAITEAMGAWSGVGGAPTLSVQMGSCPSVPTNDGQNSIIFAKDGYAPAGDALAVTVNWVDDQTGEIIDSDIVINGIHSFAVLGSGATAPASAFVLTEGGHTAAGLHGTFDLQHVVTHELGHALGLGDVQNDSSDVMYAFSAPGSAAGRTPSSDDVDGVDSIYAGSAPRAGCGQSNMAGTGPRAHDLYTVIGVFSAAMTWLAVRRQAARASTAQETV
jgi:hypothetical protein